MDGVPWLRPSLVVVAVIGSASIVSGFGAGEGTRQMCEAINLARQFGISLDEALETYSSDNNLPEGCNLDVAFDQMCSEEGLACSDDFVVPTRPAYDTEDIDENIVQINEFSNDILNFANCWDENGALCTLSDCVSATDFDDMVTKISDHIEDLETRIVTVQDNLVNLPEGQDSEDIENEIDALNNALVNFRRAKEVIEKRGKESSSPRDSVCGRSSGGSSGGPSSDTSSSGGGNADAGVIAGATVGGVVGVAAIGYGLVQANVISLSAFSAVTASDVAPLVYSEEAEGFI